MKTKFDESLGRTGATILCEGFLETVIYENVHDGVWLVSSGLNNIPKKQMETEAVLRNIERLREEGFGIRVRKPRYR